MPLSRQQELFIDELYDCGDLELTINAQKIDRSQYMNWLGDPDFGLAVASAKQFFIENLRAKIEISGLKQLDYILRYGQTTVTTKVSKEDVFGSVSDGDGGYSTEKVGEKTKTSTTKKRDRHVAWAIKEAIKLYLISRVEKDLLMNLKGLADNGLLPQDTEQVVSGYMAEFQERVKAVLSGNIESMEISDELLADIQQRVING